MASYNSTSSSLDSLRKWLNDIIGSHSAEIFSDDFLGSYLRQFGGRVDAVQCALESLIEEYYNEANQQMNNICPTDLLDKKPEKPIEFFKLPFFKRVRLFWFYFILIQQLHGCLGLTNVVYTVTGAWKTCQPKWGWDDITPTNLIPTKGLFPYYIIIFWGVLPPLVVK